MQDRTKRVVTAKRLREVLHYNPDTGIFTWLVRTGVRVRVGARAGAMSGGYRVISIDGISYRAGRLAWLYMRGRWPRFEVDHGNRCRDDDRWENLEDKTSAEQKHNRGRRTGNTSGFAGVGFYKPKNKWRARVMVNGRTRTAYCETRDEAVIARDAIRAEFGLNPAIDDLGGVPTAFDHDLTPADYAQIITRQRGCCGACKQPAPFTDDGKPTALLIDLDKEGKLRGLICRRCKPIIDHLPDDPQVLKRLIAFGTAVKSGVMKHDRKAATITGPQEVFDAINEAFPLRKGAA